MLKQKNEKNGGITLIALVITIIVLLILAGVSIAMLMGNNGILTQANNAKVEQSHGAVREGIALAYNEWQIELNTANMTKLASTEIVQIQGKEERVNATTSSFLDFLISKGYCNSEGIIDTEKLTGSKQALGNGTGTTDVYKVEEQDGKYVVSYYDNSQSKEEIWTANSNAGTDENKPTSEDFFTFDEETGTITGIVENTSKDPNGIGYYYEGDSYDGIGTSSETNIIIPETINGVTVKAIGELAFANIDNVESIILPDTVETIGREAFKDNKINTITLSNTLKSIGEQAFLRCRNLKEIVIPSSVTSISGGASYDSPFFGCSNLTKIVLEKGNTLEIPGNKWGATNATVTKEQ